VVVFDKILDENHNDWETVFKVYENSRKKDTDAIADLAIDNFYEMKGHVNHANFREKRTLEMAFEKAFPSDYSSKYSLVTFNENISYREAMLKGRAQDKAILNMLADGDISTVNNLTNDQLKTTLEKVKIATEAILEDDRIAGLNK
jgi:kynurenine 3-monooxygenase